MANAPLRVAESIEALEVCAHFPYRSPSDNHGRNGLLLRADLHVLLDLDLVGIQPRSLRVKLHPKMVKD